MAQGVGSLDGDQLPNSLELACRGAKIRLMFSLSSLCSYHTYCAIASFLRYERL